MSRRDARIAEIVDRRLTVEELDAYVSAPWAPGEKEELLGLIAWFRKRYPTPGERLASARRAYSGLRPMRRKDS